MLGPHHRVDAKLDKVRIASKACDQPVPFLSVDPVTGRIGFGLLSFQVLKNGRCVRHARSLASSAASRQSHSPQLLQAVKPLCT